MLLCFVFAGYVFVGSNVRITVLFIRMSGGYPIS